MNADDEFEDDDLESSNTDGGHEDDAHDGPDDEEDGQHDEENTDSASEDDDNGESEDGTSAGASGSSEGNAAPKRGSSRIASLVKERNALREEKARLEGMNAGMSSRSATPVDTEAARRAREEKLALMTPEERREFERDEKIQTMQFQTQLAELRAQDSIDKFSYQTEARGNAVFAKHADEVERRLAAERQNGRNWSRRDILEKIIGELALKAKPKPKEREAANRRVTNASSRPVSTRSNVTRAPRAGGKFQSIEQFEKDFGDVVF